METSWRLGMLVVCCVSTAWAVDWKALPQRGYVSDFAGVVDAATKARLEGYCAAVERSAGVRMALVTIGSLEGEPVEDVANAIARGWGDGRKKGVLLLLAIQDRRQRLEIGDGLERILPDGLESRVLHEMRPAIRQQQYGEAVMAAAETLGGSIARARRVELDTRLPRRMRPAAVDWVPWALLAAGLAVVAALVQHRSAKAHGASSGGGFGGYDSGDGCGGFGGGDFGDGAASAW